jgi:hypothetical protein
MTKNNRKMTKKTKNRGTRNDGPEKWTSPTKGDIPKDRHFDQMTMSCGVPRVSGNYTIRQVTGPYLLTATASAVTNLTFQFNLTNLPNYTNFQSVWDQYRIVAIRQTVVPQNNAIGLVTNTATTLLDLYSVIDYDNTSNLATVNTALAYDNCMIIAPGTSATRIFRPRVAAGVYTGSVFTGFANLEDTWLDSASPSVQHYGTKYLVPAAAAAQTLLQTWEIATEYWVEFRSVF